MGKLPILIQPGFYFMVGLYLLALPLRTVHGMLIAAIMHEIGHLLATIILGGKVRRIILGAGGAVIQTDFLQQWQSIMAIVAGPTVSFMLLLLYPVFPSIAIWGLLQGVVNLLPVYPLDGGRICRIWNTQ